jgi:exosome complex component RRP42
MAKDIETSTTSNLTKTALEKMFSEGKRFDSRKLDEIRDFTIEYDISNKAEGSARIRLGKTEVVVGVKLAVGEPYPDSPDKGNLMVSAELLPLASPHFEHGPPNFQGIELPRLVDRALRESGMFDLKSLVIEPGEKVWTLFVDLYPINDDGNLIDAATIAALAALHKTKIPELDKSGKPDYSKPAKKSLSVSKEILPLSFSFYKLGDQIFLDPTMEEEEATDARITFGISEWNGQKMLNSCQKAGFAVYTQEEIDKIMDLVSKKYDEVSKKLKKFL